MMTITIKDLETAIKDVMTGSEIQFSDSVYEEKDGILRLIIFFNKLFTNNDAIIYTKLMFNVDHNKGHILTNKDGQHSFKYLYDINCQYEYKVFDTLQEFKEQWSSIIKKKKFGENIKILSEFIKNPAFTINDWLSENNITEISVTGVKYDPKVKIMPCKSLFFHFVLTVNNSENVELHIKKEKENDFVMTFQIDGENIDVFLTDLKTFVQTIGNTLKENFSK